MDGAASPDAKVNQSRQTLHGALVSRLSQSRLSQHVSEATRQPAQNMMLRGSSTRVLKRAATSAATLLIESSKLVARGTANVMIISMYGLIFCLQILFYSAIGDPHRSFTRAMLMSAVSNGFGGFSTLIYVDFKTHNLTWLILPFILLNFSSSVINHILCFSDPSIPHPSYQSFAYYGGGGPTAIYVGFALLTAAWIMWMLVGFERNPRFWLMLRAVVAGTCFGFIQVHVRPYMSARSLSKCPSPPRTTSSHSEQFCYLFWADCLEEHRRDNAPPSRQ